MTKEEQIKEIALEFAIGDVLCNGDAETNKKEYQAMLDADGDDNAMNHALVLDYYEHDTVETVLDVIGDKQDNYLNFLKIIETLNN